MADTDDDEGSPKIRRRLPRKKKIYNPITLVREYYARKKIENTNHLLKREDQMNQDFECYLMNLEEKHSWLAHEMHIRNYKRLAREEEVRKIEADEMAKFSEETEMNELESGLCFFRGNIQDNKKWQNSAARILDLKRHTGAVMSCKLSSDMKYMLSCSADKTAILWNFITGKSFRVFIGHTKRVSDGDFHPIMFSMDCKDACIVTCGVDCTLRFWSPSLERPVRTIVAHTEAVYRCQFSPDGHKIVSCGEDMTIRTWSFPQGYQLYVYRFHTSPIMTVSYSPSGKYLVSGSDYGERRLLIWDSTMPMIENSIHIGHMLYWNKAGLITKILLNTKGMPKPEFWLTAEESTLLPGENIFEAWPGEAVNDVVESESEDSEAEEAKKKQENEFNAFDVPNYEDIQLIVTAVDMNSKEHYPATEYIPGYFLIVTIRSIVHPIIDAFICVNGKENHFETFSSSSGERLGYFLPDEAIPARVIRQEILDRFSAPLSPASPSAKNANYSELDYPRREVPVGLKTSCGYEALVYKNYQLLSKGKKMEREAAYTLRLIRLSMVDKTTRLPLKQYNLFDEYVKEAESDTDNETDDDADHFSVEKESVVGSNPTLSPATSPRRRHVFTMSCIWYCPPPDKGPAVISANISTVAKPDDDADKPKSAPLNSNPRKQSAIPVDAPPTIKGSDVQVPKRVKLSVSLRESSLRCNLPNRRPQAESAIKPSPVKGKAKSNSPEQKKAAATQQQSKTGKDHNSNIGQLKAAYPFDMEMRHSSLFQYLSVKQWDSVEAMFDNKCVMYLDEERIVRPWRIVDRLEWMFGNIDNLIVPTPFVHKAGVSRSVIITENSQIRYNERPESDHDSYEDDDDDDEEYDPYEEYDNESASDEEMKSEPSKPEEVNNEMMKSHDFNCSLDSYQLEVRRESSVLPELPVSTEVVMRSKTRDLVLPKSLLVDASIATMKPKLRVKNARKLRKNKKNRIQEASSELLFSNRFGPKDIRKFTMVLPDYFPVNAGKSKKAFTYNLEKHEALLERMTKGEFPSAMEGLLNAEEEDEELDEGEKPDKHSKSFAGKKFRRLFGRINTGRRAASSSFEVHDEHYFYSSGRRCALTDLPGMTPHYPNPYYLVPTPFPEYPSGSMEAYYEKEPKSKFNLFGGKKKLTNFLAPAGRKIVIQLEDEQKLTSQVSEKLRKKEIEKSRKQFFSNAGVNPSVRKLVVVEEKKAVKRSFWPFFKKSKDPVTESVVSKESNQEVLSSQEALSSSEMVPNDHSDAKSALSPSPSWLSKLNLFRGSRRAGKKPFNNDEYLKFYLSQRRGSFPVAPGLESFIAENKTSTSSVSVENEARRVGVLQRLKEGSRHVILGNLSQEAKDDLRRKCGIIRSCSIGGFEIVHHGSINDAVFSPSEKRIASGGGDGLIKLWDTRDGLFVRQLKPPSAGRTGHIGEILSLKYSRDEQYLISGGSDYIVNVWDLTTCTVTRSLKGHSDVVCTVTITDDCNQIISGSYDGVIKTWYLTPRHPDPPEPPRVIARSETTLLLSWTAPPSYNEELTAFHLQFRVENSKEWKPSFPDKPISIQPVARTKVMNNLASATGYQFRLRAENRMGLSEWGSPCQLEYTDMGLPTTLERATLVNLNKRSVTICWFAPSPLYYGAAGRVFVVEYSGAGKSFEDNATTQVELADGMALGKKYLDKMSAELEKSIATYRAESTTRRVFHDDDNAFELKGPANKPVTKALGAAPSVDDLIQAIANVEGESCCMNMLSGITKASIVERSKNDENVFMMAEIDGLIPGLMYRFRVKAKNNMGYGTPSPESYSASTLPDRPGTPSPPYMESSTLTSVTFRWDPPDDMGSALTGYRLFIKNFEREFQLGRSEVTFTIHGLRPGRNYFAKVCAKNSVGISAYSEYNAPGVCRTMTDKPKSPNPARAVNATWSSLTIQAQLPYGNGSSITHIIVQHRDIKPFSKSDWGRPLELRIPNDVKILVPEIAEPEESLLGAGESTGPTKLRKLGVAKEVKVGLLNVDEIKLSDFVEENVNTVSSNDTEILGPMIEIVVNNLLPFTAYEFRYAVRNASGLSDFSGPSQRALTNKAEIPKEPKAPALIDVIASTFSAVLFLDPWVSADAKPGVPIKITKGQKKYPYLYVHFEVKETTLNIVKPAVRYDIVPENKYVIPNLIPGMVYQFRCMIENAVGSGPYSRWSSEIRMAQV